MWNARENLDEKQAKSFLIGIYLLSKSEEWGTLLHEIRREW